MNALFAQMESASRDLLQRANQGGHAITVRWMADMRYVGQGFEVAVALPAGPLGDSHLPQIRQAFQAAYLERFGRVVKDVAIEAVNWRLAAALPEQDITLAYASAEGDALRGTREVYFDGYGVTQARVYDRYRLRPGVQLSGPAVVEERESSCSLGPDCRFTVDGHYNLVVDIEHGAPGARQAGAATALEASA